MSNKRILSGISGCIVGVLAGNFVITEGRIIRNFLFPEASALAGTIIEIIIGILAVGVFLLTVRWFFPWEAGEIYWNSLSTKEKFTYNRRKRANIISHEGRKEFSHAKAISGAGETRGRGA